MKVFTQKFIAGRLTAFNKQNRSMLLSCGFLVMMLFTMLFGKAQTSVQNFGTGTGSQTSQTASTSFIPAPVGSGTTYARAGATAPAAPINLVTASNPLGTTGAYVRAVASSSTSVAKFSPWVGYTSGTEFYTSFKVLFGDAAGTSTATSGLWGFYQGAGAMYSDNNNFAGAQVFTGLQFTFGPGGALALAYRLAGAASITGLTQTAFSSGTVYTIEIVGNNKTSGTINYTYNGVAQSVAVQKFDLYVNGTKIGDDLGEGQLPANTGIVSGTFIGASSTANVANVFVDDAVTYNAVPVAIGVSAPIVTTNATPSALGTTTATLNGSVTSDGNSPVLGRGVVYSQTSVNATPAQLGTGVTDASTAGTTGAFSVPVSPLAVNTQYSYRAYATNAIGTSYGGASGTTFYTLANVPNAPVVGNPSPSTLDVAIGSGDGNPSGTEYAIQETGGNYVQAGGSLSGSAVWQTAATWATVTVTGLAPSTLYTFQVKARNGALTETAFGSTASSTTQAAINPTLNGSALTGFGPVCINTTPTANTFTITGSNLTTDPVTVASLNGYSYSTDDISYFSSLSITQPGGSFSQLVYVKLSPTAVQSYDGNIVVGGGGASSTNIPATGSGINTAPSVTTGGSSLVTQVSATLNGTITVTGCSAISAYGIEYSTLNGFTNGTGTQVSGGTLNAGVFSSGLSNLSPATTYYYKAFATNGGGTTYGDQQSFVTSGLVAPVATAATSVTSTGFTANWNASTGADNYRLDVSTLAAFGSTPVATDLFISEYVEGSSSNKYIEIYNGTGATVNLANYKLRLYANGAATATNDISLSGSLLNGATIVYKNSGATVYGGAATTNAAVNFNGNDAVALFKVSTSANVDIFGTIGENPPGGAAWTAAGGYSTLDKTLVRKPGIASGITTNPGPGFPTLSTEWIVLPIDNVSNLGSHSNFVPSLVPGYNDLTVNGLSQAVTGLAHATNYFYRVRAASTNSTSPNSIAIPVTTCAVITATTGPNGTVSPLGATDVCAAGNQAYAITPAACYHVADVLVNGISIGAVSSHTFNNVTGDSSISATFALNSQIPAPTVTGPTNVCPYLGTGDPVTYTFSSAGATGFSYILPPNVSTVSTTTNSVTVNFPVGFASQANKQIKVTATSACGNSTQTIYYLLTQAPGTPGPITGITNVCGVIGTPGTITYSVAQVPGAASYLWTAQAGNTTITYPFGNGVNGNTVNVSFGPGFTSSSISVVAVNGCGTSGGRALALVKTNPAQPGLITGPTNACAFITPGGPAAYSVTAVAGLTYAWTVPANLIGLTGETTPSVSFTYPTSFNSGTVSVIATNGCGSSIARTLSVTKLNPTATTAIDVIQTAPCPNRVYTYSVAGIPANATSVQWTIPTTPGTTLVSGQGTASITVSYPSTAVDGTVTAQAVSNCGNSSIRQTKVKLPVCSDDPPPPPPPFAKAGTITTAPAGTMQVNVFPNPSVSDFKLQVLTAGKEIIQVRISDIQGRELKNLTVMPYQTTTIGSDLKAGAYMVEVRQGDKLKTTKLLKF